MMSRHETLRAAGWLPSDPQAQVNWLNDLAAKVKEERKVAISSKGLMASAAPDGFVRTGSPEWPYKHAEMQEFADLLESDPVLHLLLEQMVAQAYKYNKKDPSGHVQIDDSTQMLHMIDYIMATAPEYMPKGAEGRGLIGFPINAILDWCMGTQAGYAFFLDERVNRHLEKILNRWCKYLCSEGSKYVLNTSETGWLCDDALEELGMDQYECSDSRENYYGFKSWNDFFCRKFKEGQRPVDSPEDPYVIVNACESAPYKISKDVKADDQFWLKGQPYSLKYMLGSDQDTENYYEKFVGGTVYQAFLSATKYHRWHSPVDGKVVKCYNIKGTYYAECRSFPYDDASPNNSQGYITHVAARAVILIECDNPDIGLVGFIAVGMAEVSSCVISVKEGDSVKKGTELGYFQFGGSTHCLLFQKDVIDTFVADAIPAEDFNDSTVIKLSAKLATAKKRRDN